MPRKFINSNPIKIALGAALITFFTSLYIYDRLQVTKSIVRLEAMVAKEKVARQCGEASARLMLKIGAAQHKEINATSIEILASYEVALNLAMSKDIRCLMMEEMGDAMQRAYKAGYKDGEKEYNLGGV